MEEPYTVHWGILATGTIAKTFTRDLIHPRPSSSSSNIAHTLTAVASSTSLETATAFLRACNAPPTTLAYPSYATLLSNPTINCVYIATPHSHHYALCRQALLAGKNVLCEKPITVNAKQAAQLFALAKEKKLFLMEGVWTRFFPLTRKVLELLHSGRIGTVKRVIADTSFAGPANGEDYPLDHRLLNPNLAGGALLDVGIYSLTWVFLALYHVLPVGERRAPERVVGLMSKHPVTGTDDTTSVVLGFPGGNGDGPQGIALSSIRVATNPQEGSPGEAGPAIRIQGTQGEIAIDGPTFRPTRFRFLPISEAKAEVFDFPISGSGESGEKEGFPRGMFWEADEVGRCLRDGKLQSENMGWEESLEILRVMDEVRRLGGLGYPEKVEGV